jgi:hypothetical protein
MKSIKEKAEEYARDYLFSPLPQRAPNVHFEAGANYVLDVIIECMPKTHSFNSNEAIDIIVSRIKQLKSN